MRVAQITSLMEDVPPKNHNGLEFIIHFLTEGLVDRGHQVSLFATQDSKTTGELVPIWLGSSVEKDRRYYWGVDEALLSRWSHVSAYMKSHEFDILHSHDYLCGLWANLDSPLVFTIHSPVGGLYGEDFKNHFAPEVWRFIETQRDNLRQMNLVFVSEAQKKTFPKGKNHFVVPNGVPVNDFTLGDGNGGYVVFLGYISPFKGPHLALQVAMKAGKKIKIAGPIFNYLDQGFFDKKIKPFIDDDQVEYLGPVGYQEKIKLLQKAEAILVPIQWEEPFGLVMIEAMSCGTPVVALNRAAVPEIVSDGKTGFVCQDVDEMAEKLNLVQDLNRKDCRDRVLEHFSIEVMVKSYEKVYQQIIENHSL